jgi:hypothetical protein
MPPSSVHFNGSVNLPDAETVMLEISSRIPDGVRRMTDGETGDRNYWISFQTRKFEQMPEFEKVASGKAYETSDDAPDMPQLRLAEGASADTIEWPNLGYADAARRHACVTPGTPSGATTWLQRDRNPAIVYHRRRPRRWPDPLGAPETATSSRSPTPITRRRPNSSRACSAKRR